ncbi:hypothetical protein [Dokdonella sp.]|uniref:hypothetical protein n=1 Tax=Dokdonella sp. TaxID=2291710 RepID=UPI0035270C77
MKHSVFCSALILSAGVVTCAVAQSDQTTANPPDKTTVIIRSGGTGYTPSGPAPAFAELDQDGDANLSPLEAKGYKLLANDFLKADSDESGLISAAEYERWAAQP